MARWTRTIVKSALLIAVFCLSAQIASAGKCFTIFAECNYEVRGCEYISGSCLNCPSGCCTYEWRTCDGSFGGTGWSITCFRTCD
jgi:hypothetical protein